MRAIRVSNLHRRGGCEEIIAATSNHADVASEVASLTTLATPNRDRKDDEERDKERWTKLKWLKQVFHVKKGKAKEDLRLSVGNTPG